MKHLALALVFGFGGLALAQSAIARAENLGTSEDAGLRAKDCRYGPDTCLGGYVWRGATQTDHVCVSPPTRDETHADNTLAGQRRTTSGGRYGPDTCKAGFVWRGVTATDHICVTPQTRAAVQEDNRLAASRKSCR